MNDTNDEKVAAFLDQRAFAVAGASTHKHKYGNKVVRVYQQNHRTVYPINPRAEVIEGVKCYPDVTSIPVRNFALSMITPPKITLAIVRDALSLGIRYFWMQPGAENQEAIDEAQLEGATVIHGGPCVLVALGYRE